MKQIEVAGFKAIVKSKPRQLKLSAREVERLLGSPKQTASSPEEKVSEPSADSRITTLFQVTGMHCKSCVVNIQDNISKLPGVSSVVVSLENRQASIQHNPKQVSAVELQKAIEALPPGNFKAIIPTSAEPSFLQPLVSVAEIHIEGMTCGSCVQSIEGMISQKKGVRSAQVSLSNHQGTFEYDPLLTSPEELRASIEDMGFDAFLPGKCFFYSTEGKYLPFCMSSGWLTILYRPIYGAYWL